MKLRPVGDHAVLIELRDNRSVHALAAKLRERLSDAFEEIVAGHETLLVSWRPGFEGRGALAAELASLEDLWLLAGASSAAPAAEVVIPVVYDGEDLAVVAKAAGVSQREVPLIHAASTYTAAFIGFAPGFAYLIGGDQRLHVPRRKTPRVMVPAGAVAVAGEYSAVYPSDGPGGWQIIGHTAATLFDPSAGQPVLLTPGTRVRFEGAL